jgi:chemotaxis signal transduction protein
MEYLCHKSPRLCSICRNHNPVLSSFMTYHRVCNQNTTADTILVKHELFTIPEHLRSLPALAGSCIVLYIIVFWFHRLSFDHCVVCPSLIYAVWLPHWYLWFTASDYPIGIFDLRRLITPLVSLIYAVWLPHWYLWSTASDYPIGIFDLRRLITPLVSLIYGVWLPHWYLWFTPSDYPIGIFDLRRLITPLVSSDCFMHVLLNAYQHNNKGCISSTKDRWHPWTIATNKVSFDSWFLCRILATWRNTGYIHKVAVVVRTILL